MPKGATRLKRRCFLFIVVLLVTLPIAWVFLAWLAAREITSPSRRAIQDYHQVILNDPTGHGITITSFALTDGTPTLLCRPDPKGSLDKRGTLLRTQLDDDPLIPFESAQHLFNSIGAPTKSWVNVGSGTHGNVLITDYPLDANMTAWFLKHLVP
jgi:hypothetical protein